MEDMRLTDGARDKTRCFTGAEGHDARGPKANAIASLDDDVLTVKKCRASLNAPSPFGSADERAGAQDRAGKA
jgi:hypothetical protein